MSDPNKQWIEVGLLLRGQLRRELTKSGIRFTETRGGGTSVFIIREDPATYQRICKVLERESA